MWERGIAGVAATMNRRRCLDRASNKVLTRDDHERMACAHCHVRRATHSWRPRNIIGYLAGDVDTYRHPWPPLKMHGDAQEGVNLKMPLILGYTCEVRSGGTCCLLYVVMDIVIFGKAVVIFLLLL